MDLIDRALAEDVGDGDATTLATVAPRRAHAPPSARRPTG
jgi:nicotinate-nucleotide pyrophosphorylase